MELIETTGAKLHKRFYVSPLGILTRPLSLTCCKAPYLANRVIDDGGMDAICNSLEELVIESKVSPLQLVGKEHVAYTKATRPLLCCSHVLCSAFLMLYIRLYL